MCNFKLANFKNRIIMKKLFTILLITVFAINACGPTLEGEKEDWKKNLEAMAKLKQDLPVFIPLIDKKIEEAKKAWEAAEGISDEEKKLEKMVEANSLLDAGTIGNLRNMKSKISSLKSKKESLLRMKTPDFKMESRVSDAKYEAESAVRKANLVLNMTESEFGIDEAPRSINMAWTALNDAYKEIEIIIGKINKENKAKKDKEVAKEKKVADDKKKAEDAKKDVKCSYCGTPNKHDYRKCSSCAAPRD